MATLGASVSATDRVLTISGDVSELEQGNLYSLEDEIIKLTGFESAFPARNIYAAPRPPWNYNRWVVSRGVAGSVAAAHASGTEVLGVNDAYVAGDDLSPPDPLVNGASFDVRAYGAVLDGVTDDSPALLEAVERWYAAGGGEILIPGQMRVDSQIVIPNDGATPPTQPPLRLRGTGAHFSGRSTPPPTNAPFLDLRYDGTYGKIISNGLGLIDIEGLTFKDTAETDTPFLYGTNTTWHVHGNSFIGSKLGVLCDQDAMVFGGTDDTVGGAGWNDGFQGYNTVIRDNYFGGIRRAVYGRVHFNGNVIRDNTIWATCGSDLAGGAAIEIDGHATGGVSAGNVIDSNLIEVTGYPYAIKLSNAGQNSITTNSIWDPTGGVTLAAVRFESSARDNLLIDGYKSATLAGMSDANAAAALNKHFVFDSIADKGVWPHALFAHGLTMGPNAELRGGTATLPLTIAPDTTAVGGGGLVVNTKNNAGTDTAVFYTVSGYSFPYIVFPGYMRLDSNLQTNGGLGFYGADPNANLTKPEITGSRGGNAALADLLTTLASLGLITDSSS